MATTQVSTSVLKDGSVTSAKLDTNIAITGNLIVDTNTLYVDSADNRVGIGTTSPSTRLHVYESTALDHITIDGNAGDNRNLRFATEDSTRWNIYATSSAEVGSNAGSDLSFTRYSDAGGFLSAAMLIQRSSGNVGIGTSSPAEKLSVQGAIISTGGITGHGANRATLSQEGANGAFLQSYGANTSTYGSFQFRQASSDFSLVRTPLIINSSGNVGIGTTSPSAKIDLVGGDITGGLKISADKVTSAFFAFGADANETRITSTSYGGYKPLTIHTGGSESMRIDSSGVVQVRNQTPTVQLYNTDASLVANQIIGDIDFYQSDPSGVGVGVVGKIRSINDSSFQGEASLTFHTGTSTSLTERMRITSSGNIGINETNPLAELHVTGSIRSVINSTAGGNTFIGAINGVSNGHAISTDTSNNITYSWNTGTNARALTISPSGDVGIGTDSPATTLEVSTIGTGNSEGQVLAETQGANGNAGYGFRTNGTTRWTIVTIGTDGANDLRFYNVDNSAERMRITSAGAIHLSQGSGNAFVGTNAGNLGTSTGTNNSAFGESALRSNTTGGANTAVGRFSLDANTTGANNTANGYATLYANTTGLRNTASGYSALFNNTEGNYNTATGYTALYNNTTGSYNTATGYGGLNNNTTGGFNTATGRNALFANTTGDQNTACGYAALGNNTTGSNNTGIGYGAQLSSAIASNEVILGNSSVTTLRCNTQTISTLSDIRDKKDIKELQGAEAFIKELKPVSFVWNQRDGGRVDIDDNGFIAQDLIEAQEKSGHKIPNLVLENNPEKLEAAYGAMLPSMVSALQSALKEIDLLKTEIETLKNK